MANQRDKDKVKVQTWVSKKDKAALEKVIKAKGYSTLADYLAAVANGSVKIILLASILSWLLTGDPTPGAMLAVQCIGTAGSPILCLDS